MNIPNRIHPSELPEMDFDDIITLPVEDLVRLQEDIDSWITETKDWKGLLDSALDIRFRQRARNVRISHGKDTGTVHFGDGPVTITANLPKRVKWDQDRLASIIETIRHEWREDPSQYVKTELKVSEAAYAAWPEVIRERFRPARTVATGKPSYKLELKEVR